MARFTITLPESVALKLSADEEKRKIPRSTLIAQYLEQHYNAVPTAALEERIKELDVSYSDCMQELEQAKLTQEEQHAADVQQVREEVQRIKDDNAALMQQVKDEAAQNAASQGLVIKGLQNELEVTKTRTESLEEKLVIYTGLNNDLKTDKESLQKQLELVTLRLPPPKVGFWARLFGGSKKPEEKKSGND